MNYDPSIYDGKHTVLQQLEALKKQYKVAVDTINTFPTVEQLEPKIEGSETVVVDVNEAGTALEIHLDASVVSELGRALKTPMAPPSETQVVVIEPNGSQANIPLSSVGGGKLYYHHINIADYVNQLIINLEIYSTTASEALLSYDSVYSLLNERGAYGPYVFYNEMVQQIVSLSFNSSGIMSTDFTKEYSKENLTISDTVKEV